MTRLTFLGSGGGRFATITQARATGGLYLDDGVRIHVDPGPGALVNLCRAGLDPRATEAILISHCHPDHYVDAPILLEALNPTGRDERGTLVGPSSVLDGGEGQTPTVHPFHQDRASLRQVVEPGAKVLLGPMVMEATPSDHSDPATVGFKFHTEHGIISYVADTALNEELIKAHRGARVLILPNTRPDGDRIPGHLCSRDSEALIEALQPEITLLNHFGLRMVRKGPEDQATAIQKATSLTTTAVRDFMQVEVGPDLELTTDLVPDPPASGTVKESE